MEPLLPWHRSQWDRLQRAYRQGKLPHGLLLSGPSGMGKSQFAERLTHAILCESPTEAGDPCQRCRSCELIRAGSHPDMRHVSPAEEGKTITVDQIREISHYATLKTQQAGYKVITISPADRMNVNAANSLLKTLEEPMAWSLLLLLTNKPASLPATIRSRCQRLDFPVPDEPLSLNWLADHVEQADAKLLLALAGGAPLAAKTLAEQGVLEHRQTVFKDFCALAGQRSDPLAVAEAWSKEDVARRLEWLYGWVADMIRLSYAPDAPTIINMDLHDTLQAMSERVDLETLYGYLDAVAEGMRLAQGQINIQLLLEDLLIHWSSCFTHGKRGNQKGRQQPA